MRILITNDDGVTAPGIAALARAVAAAGHEVVVVAPAGEASGSGAAVGHLPHGTRVAVQRHELAGLDGVDCFGVDGPPARCVLFGFFEAFGPRPDLVLSGVNPGANTGRSLLQSGTVGAVLTGADLGISGLAVSVALGEANVAPRYDTASEVAVRAIEWLAAAPRKTALNVNVPNVSFSELAGVKAGRISAFGPTAMTVIGPVPGSLEVVVSAREVALKADTDTALVAAGYVAVTSLVTPRAVDGGEAAAALLAAFGGPG